METSGGEAPRPENGSPSREPLCELPDARLSQRAPKARPAHHPTTEIGEAEAGWEDASCRALGFRNATPVQGGVAGSTPEDVEWTKLEAGWVDANGRWPALHRSTQHHEA